MVKKGKPAPWVEPPKTVARIKRKNILYVDSASTELQRGHVILEDVIEHIYPMTVNPIPNNVAKDLIELLLAPKKIKGVPRPEVVRYLLDKGHKKATIQNGVIPMLKRRGILKETKEQGLTLVKDFSNMLKDIASCWDNIYMTAEKLSKRE